MVALSATAPTDATTVSRVSRNAAGMTTDEER